MTRYSNKSMAGNLDVADRGSEVEEACEDYVVSEQIELDLEDEAELDFEDDETEDWFEPESEVEGECQGESIAEVDEDVDLMADDVHESGLELEEFEEFELEPEFKSDELNYDGEEEFGRLKISSIKETLLRTRTKVTGLFVANDLDAASCGDERDADLDEFDDFCAVADVGVADEDEDWEAENFDDPDSPFETGDNSEEIEYEARSDGQLAGSYMSEEACNEMVETLQSDAELDAEVAAAIEVSSLLDAVALLQRFDKELAEVEAVLCTE